MEYTTILNIRIADGLIKEGFNPASVKPSRKIQGRACFIFENSPEFQKAFKSLVKQQ